MIIEYPTSRKAYLAVILGFSILLSCRTAEKIPDARIKPLSSVRLYKNAEENSFDYRQFRINKINIQLINNENKTSFRASIHAVKDSSVLVSITKLNILLARVQLTPDSIKYINYFEKIYYAGDYGPIRNLLNYNLNFTTVQAIVSADIFSLFDKKKDLREYKTWIENGKYVLQSESFWKLTRMEEKGKTQRVEKILKRIEEDIPVVQTFYFDPVTFWVRNVEMEDKTSHRMAKLIFSDYEQVGDQYFPASIDFLLNTGEDTIQLFSKLAGFSTEEGEFVSLRIPEKFQRIFLN